jgi:hypothetical protein
MDTEHFLSVMFGNAIFNCPVSSSIWTEARGTSKQGESSRGLLARNSTISDTWGRRLRSKFQQDRIKPSLHQEPKEYVITFIVTSLTGL